MWYRYCALTASNELLRSRARIVHEGFVTTPSRRHARLARGGAMKGGILETGCRPTERRARQLGRV